MSFQFYSPFNQNQIKKQDCSKSTHLQQYKSISHFLKDPDKNINSSQLMKTIPQYIPITVQDFMKINFNQEHPQVQSQNKSQQIKTQKSLDQIIIPNFFNMKKRGITGNLNTHDYLNKQVLVWDSNNKGIKQYFRCDECQQIFEKACALGGHVSRSHKKINLQKTTYLQSI